MYMHTNNESAEEGLKAYVNRFLAIRQILRDAEEEDRKRRERAKKEVSFRFRFLKKLKQFFLLLSKKLSR